MFNFTQTYMIANGKPDKEVVTLSVATSTVITPSQLRMLATALDHVETYVRARSGRPR